MKVLSLMVKIVVQIAIVIVVPGGLPAVLVYQYRRLQKRRRDAISSRPTETPSADTGNDKEILPESPR